MTNRVIQTWFKIEVLHRRKIGEGWNAIKTNLDHFIIIECFATIQIFTQVGCNEVRRTSTRMAIKHTKHGYIFVFSMENNEQLIDLIDLMDWWIDGLMDGWMDGLHATVGGECFAIINYRSRPTWAWIESNVHLPYFHDILAWNKHPQCSVLSLFVTWFVNDCKR